MRLDFKVDKEKLDCSDPFTDVDNETYGINFFLDVCNSEGNISVFQDVSDDLIPVGIIVTDLEDIVNNYAELKLRVSLWLNRVDFTKPDTHVWISTDFEVNNNLLQLPEQTLVIGEITSVEQTVRKAPTMKSIKEQEKREKNVEYILKDTSYQDRIKMFVYSKFYKEESKFKRIE